MLVNRGPGAGEWLIVRGRAMLERMGRWWLPVVVVTLLWSLVAAAHVLDGSRLSGLIRQALPLGGGSHPQQDAPTIAYQYINGQILEVADIDVPLPADATPYDGVFAVKHVKWSWSKGFWAATHRQNVHSLFVTMQTYTTWLPEEVSRELIARFKADAVARGMMTADIAARIDQDGRRCIVRVPYWPGIALNVAWVAMIGLVALRVGGQMANRKGPNSK